MFASSSSSSSFSQLTLVWPCNSEIVDKWLPYGVKVNDVYVLYILLLMFLLQSALRILYIQPWFKYRITAAQMEHILRAEKCENNKIWPELDDEFDMKILQ